MQTFIRSSCYKTLLYFECLQLQLLTSRWPVLVSTYSGLGRVSQTELLGIDMQLDYLQPRCCCYQPPNNVKACNVAEYLVNVKSLVLSVCQVVRCLRLWLEIVEIVIHAVWFSYFFWSINQSINHWSWMVKNRIKDDDADDDIWSQKLPNRWDLFRIMSWFRSFSTTSHWAELPLSVLLNPSAQLRQDLR